MKEDECEGSELEAGNIASQCVGLATIRNLSLLEKAKLLQKQEQAINITPFATNGSTIAAQRNLSSCLRSDITRHGSGVARIWINENSTERVREILLQCLYSDETIGELRCVE